MWRSNNANIGHYLVLQGGRSADRQLFYNACFWMINEFETILTMLNAIPWALNAPPYASIKQQPVPQDYSSPDWMAFLNASVTLASLL